MKWIIEDIKRAITQLRKWETWLVIGVICIFALLAYWVSRYAFKTDSTLIYLWHTATSCRTMTNGTIIAMFCGMIFFVFTAVLTLGEFQRYFEYRAHAAHRQAGQSLRWGIFWCAVAIGIAVAALVFFNTYCR